MFVYFCLIDMQIGGLGRISPDRLQLSRMKLSNSVIHLDTHIKLSQRELHRNSGLISLDTYPHRFEARSDVGWFCWQFWLLCYRRP